jgi:uncharacterized protein YeaO (DUF488 family)
MTGSVDETYVAALQHDLVEPGDAALVGVVRRPTGWFRAETDENRPALGPPEALLDETKDRTEELKRRGMCDEGAHNAAWEETDFTRRYREYLDADPAARDALSDLAGRVAAGEAVWLVCFEGEGKRCHRHPLAERLRERVA